MNHPLQSFWEDPLEQVTPRQSLDTKGLWSAAMFPWVPVFDADLGNYQTPITI